MYTVDSNIIMEHCIWKVQEEDRLCKFCKVYYCLERKKSGSKRKGTILGTLRQMNIGEEKSFSFEHYGAIRTAAMLLRRDFSVLFVITTKKDKVQVQRIK